MNLMLLAAGEGTRLRPYTHQLPKPAIPFLNLPLASHSLSFLNDIAIDKLVVNTFHLPEKIHCLFHKIPHGAKELIFSDEVGEILGNGGGLGKARQHFHGGGDFIMMNSDEVILPKDADVLKKAIAQHKASGALATLMVMDHPGVGTQFGGVWVDSKENKVRGFGKTAIPNTDKAWHFIGVQILSERIFQYIPSTGASNILYDGVAAGIAQGELVQVCPFECSWFETGNIKDFLEASEKCLGYLMSSEPSSEKAALERAFQRYANGKMITQDFAGAHLHFSNDARIDNNSKFEGFVCFAEGSRLPKECKLKNVIVGEGVSVAPGTEAENTLLL
ncbi:sugar phosphate nucleotidyltransferase [Bdellovibrio sp. NC01]|uniref:sugar phosphate nucleotidyltransferase n=1 Tax=Bdellovibrio sp. NC01 TaxID=2220073 RepID=UPI001157B821|nr:sugar phosphate nucleotidyltransferase [Bdellovibrio sp. NC01]QDK39438.1 mannose-1-phosphate guanyltransferase [Bdellovibrio sp. NC01]